jgi:glutamate 5-kinase
MNKPTIVIKYGSDSVTNDHGIDEIKLNHHVDQLALLHKDYRLVLVSSGAVAVGRTMLPESERAIEHDEQSLAMAGSAGAFMPWQAGFQRHGIACGQLLITHREIKDKDEGNVMLAAIQKCLDRGWVVVANENDALSVDELRQLAYGGDNDGLAGHIAAETGADKLLLLTSRPGLLNEQGNLVRTVVSDTDYENAKRLALAGPPSSRPSGMQTKVEAAWTAATHGIDAYIADAMANIDDVLAGQGTHFSAHR